MLAWRGTQRQERPAGAGTRQSSPPPRDEPALCGIGGAGIGGTRPPPGPSFPAPGPQRWGVGVSVPRKQLGLACLHRLNSRLAHLSEEQTFLLLENPSFGERRTDTPPPMSESPREGRGVHVTFSAATHLPDALCGGASSSPKGVGGQRGTTPACTPTPSPLPSASSGRGDHRVNKPVRSLSPGLIGQPLGACTVGAQPSRHPWLRAPPGM